MSYAVMAEVAKRRVRRQIEASARRHSAEIRRAYEEAVLERIMVDFWKSVGPLSLAEKIDHILWFGGPGPAQPTTRIEDLTYTSFTGERNA